VPVAGCREQRSGKAGGHDDRQHGERHRSHLRNVIAELYAARRVRKNFACLTIT
jgi:hypothetical protein